MFSSLRFIRCQVGDNHTGLPFIESLFYYKSDQQEFTPYLSSEKEGGKTFQIISDSVNGEKIYPYQSRLYPEHLKINVGQLDVEEGIASLSPSTDWIYRMYRRLIPRPEVFDTYIPRPHFFYDVLYPSLTENFVERWIRDVIFSGKDWKTIKFLYGFEPLVNFKKYNKLYEKFDLYYIHNENELFCIDVKAWSRVSGNRLSKETLKKTHRKLDSITSSYPEFSKVKGLLLNLHSMKEKSHKYSPTLFSGSLIFFGAQYFPVESKILKDFLFSKEL